MQAALRLKAIVLPGHRVEFGAPELMEGEEVELITGFRRVPGLRG